MDATTASSIMQLSQTGDSRELLWMQALFMALGSLATHTTIHQQAIRHSLGGVRLANAKSCSEIIDGLTESVLTWSLNTAVSWEQMQVYVMASAFNFLLGLSPSDFSRVWLMR